MTVRAPTPSRPMPRLRRDLLMLGCALGAMPFVLADRADAQAFNATPATQPGSGTVVYDRATPGIETVTINSPSAIVNWTVGTAVPGVPINFLPTGNTATFQGGAGNPNFVVLNRIINSGTSAIRFDGRLISRQSAASAVPSGTVLFSNPGGIIVGRTAIFDVGSLVLTSLDVIDSSGSFITPGGGFQFRNGRGRGTVETEAGSQISANADGSSIAFVAPALTHAGSIRANGSAGFVAAESVDVAFNGGLFDIVVQANGGTSVGGTVITHSGSTTGPASSGAGDNHRIYTVGVPESNAISMLLGGTIGYDAPINATVENGQIVLSSGYTVDDGVVVEIIDNGAPASTIASSGGNFTSDVIARARSGIAFSASTSDLIFAGDFDALSRGAVVGLLAENGFDINVGGNVLLATMQFVRSATNPDSVGGTAAIQANAGSTIAIAGNATLDSSALGVGFLDGSFVGRGGAVRVTGNGAVSITGNLNMNAIGSGRDGGFGGAATIDGSNTITVGGNFGTNTGGSALVNTVGATGGVGQGGTVTLTTTGSILIGGTSTIAAAGVGGDVTGAASSTGGDGIGGTIDIDTNGGTIDLGTLTGFGMFGRGGTAQAGGAGTGGTLNVELRGGIVDLGNAVLIVGDGTGGAGISLGGDGTGGGVLLTPYSSGTGSTLRSGLMAANVDGIGGAGDPAGGTGGVGRGGSFDLLLDAGDAAVTIGGIIASANGIGGNGATGGDGFGGGVLVVENEGGLGLGAGGASTLGNLSLTATGGGGVGSAGGGNGTGGQIALSAGRVPATGGSGIAIAVGQAVLDASGTGGASTSGTGGVGTGGTARIEASAGGAATLAGLTMRADAAGGTGAGAATAGTSSLIATGGRLTLNGQSTLTANATGPGAATGGLIELTAQVDGAGTRGTLIAGNLTGSASATGATPAGSTAGHWALLAQSGNISFGNATLSASGIGGLAATGAGTLFVADGTIGVTGLGTFSTVANINIGASGAGQYTGGGYAFATPQNIAVTHVAPVAGSPTFAAASFSATPGGTFISDAGTIIRGSNLISIAAGGAVSVAGSLLGGDINVSGSSVSFNQLTGGAIAVTSGTGNISGATATGTTLTFDAAQIASFGGVIAGNDIRVVSRDIDIGAAARLGNAGTQLVQLTARQSGLQTVIGGAAQGAGYTLTNAEAGRIRAAQLAILASANGTAANRAPDVLLRDLSLSATPTAAGTAVNRLVVTVGVSAPAILQVEGGVSLANAGANDGITITAPGRLQTITPIGSVRVRDSNGAPAGRIQFSSNNIWSASQSLINQLIADPNFPGRNAALLNNDGAVQPRGYIEAADVVLQVGGTAFIQNSGTVPVNFDDGDAYAGITVSRNTLTITPTGSQPIQVYAFGRSLGANGASSVNSGFFREVAFGRPNGQTTSYTDASELNQCVINTGACPLRIPEDFNEPEGPEIIEGPVDGGDAILNPQAPDSDVIDTSFANEELIEELVTSGAEANVWDCDDPRDERCRRQPRSER